jgi:hypothetical protein
MRLQHTSIRCPVVVSFSNCCRSFQTSNATTHSLEVWRLQRVGVADVELLLDLIAHPLNHVARVVNGAGPNIAQQRQRVRQPVQDALQSRAGQQGKQGQQLLDHATPELRS